MRVFFNPPTQAGCDALSVIEAEFNRFEISFPSLRVVAIPSLKHPAALLLTIARGEEWINNFLKSYMKCKQCCSGFEFGLRYPFFMIMNTKPWVSPYIYIYVCMCVLCECVCVLCESKLAKMAHYSKFFFLFNTFKML